MKKITADVAAIPLKWSTKPQPPTMLVAIPQRNRAGRIVRLRLKAMYLPLSIGVPPDDTKPRRGPLPWREAMQLAERRLFDDYSRACAGVSVLEVLRRDATDPIAFWERVIRWLPKLFEIKRKGEQLVREGRRNQAEIDENLRWQMRHVYPPDYALGTEQEELARARLHLSESALARTSRSNPA